MSIYSRVSGFYGIPDYEQKIAILSREKQTTTDEKIKIKSDVILDKISKIVIKDPGIKECYRSSFTHAVDQALLDISLLKPGRRLFKCLLNSPFPIKIRCSDDCRVMDIRIGKEMWEDTASAFISIPEYYLSNIDVTNRLMPDGYPIALGLVHELIHAKHYIESDVFYRMRSFNKGGLLSNKFDNHEEQLTICGLEEKHSNLDQRDGTIDICENAFVQAFGFNFKKSHRGIKNHRGFENHQQRIDDPACNDIEKVIINCIYEGSYKEALSFIKTDFKNNDTSISKNLLKKLLADLENYTIKPRYDGLIFEKKEDKNIFYEILGELNELVPENERIPLPQLILDPSTADENPPKIDENVDSCVIS